MSRKIQLLLLLVSLVSVAVRSEAPTVSASRAPRGTDGDGVPAGLSEEEEVAWVLAHMPTPPITVTP